MDMNLDALEKAVGRMKWLTTTGDAAPICAYLKEIAAEQPDGLFPGGITVEQAANEITAITQAYTSMLKQNLTAEDVRKLIQASCKEMEPAQAEEFLVGIRTVCDLLKNPRELVAKSDDELHRMVKTTAEALHRRVPESCDEEYLDALFMDLDPFGTSEALKDFIDEILQQTDYPNRKKYEDYVALLCSEDLLDTKERLYFAAAVYGEAVRSGTLPKDASPGLTALADTAAYDMIMVSVLSKAGGEDELTYKREHYGNVISNISFVLAFVAALAILMYIILHANVPLTLTLWEAPYRIFRGIFTFIADIIMTIELLIETVFYIITTVLSIFVVCPVLDKLGNTLLDKHLRLNFFNLPKTVTATNNSETNKNVVLA